MSKQWVRQQVRRNEIQEFIDKGIIWITANRRAAATAAGGTLIAVLVGAGLVYRHYSIKMAAWERLSLAQVQAYSGRPEASLEQIKQLTEENPDSLVAGYGLLFAGDMLFPQGQYKLAIENYSRILERGEPQALQPLALANIVVAQEADGQFQQSLQSGQRFLESYSDHFLSPQVHTSLARCLKALGQAEQARAAYQKIALQYPDTSWAAWAQSQLQSK